jgi:hypothetical protein
MVQRFEGDPRSSAADTTTNGDLVPAAPDAALADDSRSSGGRRPGGRQRGARFTQTDAEWLRWLIRVRYADAPRLARRFLSDQRSAERVVYWRTNRFKAWGLVEWQPVLYRRPGYFVPTPAAYRIAESPLEPPRDRELKLGPILHTLGVVDLVIAYELAGHQVVTERELRAMERDDRGQPPYAVRVSVIPTEGQPMLHYPDLVVLRGQQVIAVEFEQSTKRASRVHEILAAYQASPTITHVRYFTPMGSKGRRIAATLDQQARRVGFTRGVFQVHAYRPDGGTRVDG